LTVYVDTFVIKIEKQTV